MAERTCKEHWKNKAKLGQAGKSGEWRVRQAKSAKQRQSSGVRPMRGRLDSLPQAGHTLFPGNPQLSLDFVYRNLYVLLFPERGEGTALLRLQMRDGPGAVSQPLVCDPPCAIHNTGCDSGSEIGKNSGKRRMSE